jgi:hypothetical protein
LWCEEFSNQAQHRCAMSWKFDFQKLKRFIVHVMKALTIDWRIGECLTIFAHFDRHEPLADIGDSPGDWIACGGA